MVAFKSRLGAVWGAVWALLRCVTRVGAAQYSTVQRAAKMTGRWVGGAREERFGGNAGRCSTWERRATARGYLCCCLNAQPRVPYHIKILPSLSKEFFDLAIKRGLGGTWGVFVEP